MTTLKMDPGRDLPAKFPKFINCNIPETTKCVIVKFRKYLRIAKAPSSAYENNNLHGIP